MKICLSDVTPVIANLAGRPALSVPSGMVHGMPVGLQLIGRPLDEERLLQIAAAFERERNTIFIPPLDKVLDNGTRPGDTTAKKEADESRESISTYSPDFISQFSKAYMQRDKEPGERVFCGDLAKMLNRHATIAGWIHRKKG